MSEPQSRTFGASKHDTIGQEKLIFKKRKRLADDIQTAPKTLLLPQPAFYLRRSTVLFDNAAGQGLLANVFNELTLTRCCRLTIEWRY